MRAIDTNIVVRCMVNDDPNQCAIARQFVRDNEVFISTTVLLETEWVLRSSYKQSLGVIADKLRSLIGLRTVVIGDPVLIDQVLKLVTHKIDMADAFHLASSGECSDFVTFDRALVSAAQTISGLPIRLIDGLAE